MDRNQSIRDLLDKIRSGSYTPEEEARAKYWLHELHQRDETGLTEAELERIDQEMWEAILLGESRKPVQVRRLWPRIAAAASILLMLAAGSYIVWHKQPVRQTAYYKNDIAPGGNKAILTLAGGQRISLTDAKNGNIAQQAGIQVTKTAGQLIYIAAAKENKATEMVYNTVETPRGGQYSLKLADGTIAVLDAASSIKYPVAFSGNERKVEITGQVYFEVVHNAAKPFRVSVKGETIEDIGTHFNVNAYDDEPVIKTTLIEGSVSVAQANQKVILKPGQQADLSNNNLTVTDADTEAAIAWKNNLFTGSDIKSVMRQFARWYDVEVDYEGKLPDTRFGGEISRKVKASEVFEALKRYHLSFKIEGKKVIVTSN